MLQLICYLLPSAIAVWIMEKINKQDYTLKEFIYYFCFYAVLINFTIACVLTFLFNYAQSYIAPEQFTQKFIFEYLGLALFTTILLPIIFTVIKKIFRVEISIDKLDNPDEENNEKKKRFINFKKKNY